VSRAERKRIVKREVEASLLSQDSLQDDSISRISHLNTAQTFGTRLNENVTGRNADLDDSSLSLESA